MTLYVYMNACFFAGKPAHSRDAFDDVLPTPDNPKAFIYKSMSFLRKHRMRAGERVVLKSGLSSCAQASLKHMIMVNGGNAGFWWAHCLCFLNVKWRGRMRKLAFVRWYKKMGVKDTVTGCTVLKQEFMKHTQRRRGPDLPFYDIIEVAAIEDKACVRPHPRHNDHWLVNHWAK